MVGIKKNKKSKAQPYWCFFIEKSRLQPFKFLNKTEQDKAIGALWGDLSPEDREVYKRKAKHWNENGSQNSTTEFRGGGSPSVSAGSDNTRANGKNQDIKPQNNNSSGQRNSLGILISEEKRLEDEQKAYKKHMDQKVEEMIEDAATNEKFNRQIFHLISTSHFYAESNDIFPAEIAVAKFSLVSGISKRFHWEIVPGKLPIGSSCDAREKSKNEHQYDLPRDDESDKSNFVDLLDQFVKFLLPDEQEIPILFARDKEVENVKRVVQKICSECGEPPETLDSIHVYPIEKLFYFLKNKCAYLRNNGDLKNLFPSKPFAIMEFGLRVGTFEGCKFHYDKDATNHCALAKVNGYGYLLADYCCDPTMYEMIEGQHIPMINKKILNDDEGI